jgi:hypothetical protein
MRFVLCAAVAAAPLFADFSYEQTSKITGGAMVAAMKIAGVFSKQAREPIKSTVAVKGDRMATLSADSAHIIDLSKETITQINFKEKNYSVMTFAEWSEAMKKMTERMGQKDAPEMQWKIDVKETGQTKVIQGQNTSQRILTLITEMKDKESGQTVEMKMVSDMWLAPDIQGYEEIRRFFERMGQKISWTPGSNFGQMMGGREAGEGMRELYKQASKLQGVPMLQVIRMGGPGSDAQAASGEPSQQQAQEQPKSEPSQSAAGAVAGQLGRLGGFGGFGKKKKKADEPAEQPAAQQQQKQQQQAPPTSAGLLMELTSELTAFSSAPVDEAKLQVPKGFREVESDMKKLLRK